MDNPTRFTDLQGFPEKQGAFAVGGALSVIATLDFTNPAYKNSLDLIRGILLLGMNSKVETSRTQALTTFRTVEPLHKDKEILAKLSTLKHDPEAKARVAAVSFESAQMARMHKGEKLEDLLDYFFFKENVEPILLRKASDNQACANCHANHTLLKLNEADEYGVITAAKSRANYTEISRMVSLLLNKPIAPLDDAGIGDSVHFTRGGGARWPDRKNSPEYKTILRWIQGAALLAAHSENCSL